MEVLAMIFFKKIVKRKYITFEYNYSWMILSLFIAISLIIPTASAADTGHSAAVIGAGTFESGNYVFPNNFTVGSSNAFFVNNNTQRIGIGTTAPTRLLDVRGIINASGEIYVQNFSAVSPWLYNQTGFSTTFNSSYAAFAYNHTSAANTSIVTTYSGQWYNHTSAANTSIFNTYGGQWYNHTSAANTSIFTTYDARWSSTYNASYAGFAYNQSTWNATSASIYLNDINLRVGIGTVTPLYGLDVSNNTRLSGTLSTDAAYNAFDDGLVTYIPFSEGSGSSISDKSRAGINGTTSGVVWTTGKMGYGLSFNGGDSYFDSGTANPTVNLTNNRSFTVAFWINLNNITASQQYVGINDSLSSFAFGKSATTVYAQVDSNGTFFRNSVVYTTTIGRWYHFTAVFNGTNMTLYRDATVLSAGSSTLLTSFTAAPKTKGLHIGRRAGQNDLYTNGTIDEVRVYSRALADDEIRIIYSQGLGNVTSYTTTDGLIGINTTAPVQPLNVVGRGNITSTTFLAENFFANTTRVGVGTAAPTQLLDVRGIVNVSGDVFIRNATSVAGMLYNHTSAANTSIVTTYGGQWYNHTSAANTSIFNTYDARWSLTYNASYAGFAYNQSNWNVTSTGIYPRDTSLNVSIGGTAAPYLLTVLANNTGINTRTVVLSLDHFATNSNTNGTAGIGTAILFRATDSLAQLENISMIVANLTNATSGGEAGALQFLTRTGGGNLTERVRINSIGRVGIGTTTPSALLDVNGNGSISGALFANTDNGRVGID